MKFYEMSAIYTFAKQWIPYKRENFQTFFTSKNPVSGFEILEFLDYLL